MEQELEVLLKELEIMKGMRASLDDYEKKYGERVQAFLTAHLGVGRDQQFNIVEIVKKAREAK